MNEIIVVLAMTKVIVTPGYRGWLEVSVEPHDLAILVRLVPLLETVLADIANWVAYDGEAPSITVELALDASEDIVLERALELLRAANLEPGLGFPGSAR
jgi:hypothetical protein